MRSNASSSRHAWFARRAALAVALIGGASVFFPASIGGVSAMTAEECRTAMPAASRAPTLPAIPIDVGAVLSTRGELVGRRIDFQPQRGGFVALRLPAESFVAGPFGEMLLYGRHQPGLGSEVRAVSVDTGCDLLLARPAEVVRGALPDASGAVVYVHTVNESDRRDGGVTAIERGTGIQRQALTPLAPNRELGPVFSTQLTLAPDGALAVQSCGYAACLTRVLDPASDAVATYAEPHGMLVGLTNEELIAFAPEHHRPTELLAIDRGSGAVRTIAQEVYDAALTANGDAPRLTIETIVGWLEVTP